MSLSSKQRRFTYMLSSLINFAYSEGVELTLGHAWRDEETQRRMVEKGASQTMRSKHCDRLALDVNAFVKGKYTTDKEAYRPLGEYWEALGGVWGGRFGVKEADYKTQIGWDAGHFEYKG